MNLFNRYTCGVCGETYDSPATQKTLGYSGYTHIVDETPREWRLVSFGGNKDIWLCSKHRNIELVLEVDTARLTWDDGTLPGHSQGWKATVPAKYIPSPILITPEAQAEREVEELLK